MQTPKQRVGILLSAIAVAVWIITALHWNFVQKPFFYVEHKVSYFEGAMPEAVTGMKWVPDKTAWRLIDPQCIDRVERSSFSEKSKWLAEQFAGYRWPSECVKDSKFFESRFYQESHHTVDAYLDNLINSGGDYFWANFAACFLFVVGLILFTAVDVRLLRWIKFG